MATGITLSESDILKCPICLEVIKSPKSLPCLHSFCEICIGEYIISTERKQNEKLSNYPCPVCRTIVTPTNLEEDISKWAALLPGNSTISSILDASQSNDDQKCNPCQRMKRVSKGTNWCRDCFEALCDSCKDVHCSIKLTASHKISNVVNKETQDTHGIDINAISESCSVHKNKTIIAFCFDHSKLCCVMCLTLQHRKCDNVQAIDEIVENSDFPSMNTIVSHLQRTISEIYSRTEKEKQELELSIKVSEEKATKCVAAVKDKLDFLLPCIFKEISLRGDDEINKLDDKFGQLKKLLDLSDHILKASTIMHGSGSPVQQFIHAENTKEQISKNILPLVNQFQESRNVSIQLDINSVLAKILELVDIGNVRVLDSPARELSPVAKNLREIVEFVGVKRSPVPEKITLKFNRSIRIPGSTFSCGVCFSENVVICGDAVRLYTQAIDVSVGKRITEHYWYYAKRITLEKQENMLYVTYDDGYFEKLKFDSTKIVFIQQHNVGDLGLVGGLTIFEDDIYIIVKDTVKKFKRTNNFSSVDAMTHCFASRTDCTDKVLNALVMDPRKKHLIYTSKEKEIVSCALNGNEVYSYKDTSKMPNPTILAFHSSGLIFVGDETGSVHMISSEGRYIESVISKCQNISRLCDLWFDENEKRLFLCGNEYIEIYDIS